MTPVTAIRRVLTRLWRRREPEPNPWQKRYWCTAHQMAHTAHDLVRDHDLPDFDPRPDDVLAGRP